jgi:hypothetical protein
VLILPEVQPPLENPESVKVPTFEHGNLNPLATDNTADEILSENPVTLTEILDSSDLILDIHSQITG